jgi:ATP-dependent DNA helicase RecG
MVLYDGTGRLHCHWWNMPYLEDHYSVGDELLVFGRVKQLRPTTIDHPETETLEEADEPSVHLNRIVPVYPLTEGITQRWLRSLIWRTLEDQASLIRETWRGLDLPGLPDRPQAVHDLHFPAEMPDQVNACRRLALDELIEFQLAIQRRRRNLQTHARSLPCGGDNRLIKPFLKRLGFALTPAQTRVLREIRQDLRGACPMRRLLQGDVGSGKTVVAACATLMAVESGYDVALMAPTEILAEQHLHTFERWFPPLGVRTEVLTGSRKTTTSAAADSTAGPKVYVGTHALIEGAFLPDKLGLVIIDEQHKFGVSQREELVRKGCYPHLLVMTATPIPRSLGLTLYGDLDISIIDGLPPGRGVVRTFVRESGQLPKVCEFIRQNLAEGRQAFVVYPRLEADDERAGVKAVLRESERLQAVFAPHQVGVVHGRLSGAEKENVMEAFRANRVRVLVATSVVEVGVDVPNATIMLIENAERFGLAQLHQLRGRISRSQHTAYCIMVASAKTPDAQKRLKVLAETNDGFRIAEADLQLRGPGDLLGRQQSGLPNFRFASLSGDLELIRQARSIATGLLKTE